MSNIPLPRKSLIAQPQTNIPRRSSSADNKWANATSVISQLTNAPSNSGNNRQSLIDRQSIGNHQGRSSSIGGRPSLAGRASISSKPGEVRPINTHELATSILQVE